MPDIVRAVMALETARTTAPLLSVIGIAMGHTDCAKLVHLFFLPEPVAAC